MKYRTELDALNAILEAQRTTNELLEQLISQTQKETVNQPIEDKQKRPYTRRNQNVS